MADEDVGNKCFFFIIIEFTVGFLKQTVRSWDFFQNRGSYGKSVGLGISEVDVN